jgi:hypothetical protein
MEKNHKSRNKSRNEQDKKNLDLPPFWWKEEHLQKGIWKTIVREIKKNFLLDFILKLCMKFFCWLQLCFACACKISRLGVGLSGQFLLIKMRWSKWSICKLHFQSSMRTPSIEKICSIWIWLMGIPTTFYANIAMAGNLCLFTCHWDNMYL